MINVEGIYKDKQTGKLYRGIVIASHYLYNDQIIFVMHEKKNKAPFNAVYVTEKYLNENFTEEVKNGK